MELFLRSQDKMSLISTNCVQYIFVGIDNKHCIIGGGVDLGMYDTKERCLEILDEIHNIISSDPIPCLVFTNCDITKDTYDGLNEAYKNGDLIALCANSTQENVKVLEKSTVVYQMPKK